MSIEAVRRNLYKIRKLKKHVNAVWAPAILAFSLSSLWVICTTLYCLFSGHDNTLDLWLGLAYGVSCSFRLLDLAIISDDLCSEAQDIKRMTKTARNIYVADAHVSQIQYLHDSIDPPSMRLTGASFFCVGRRLLVAMAGSVIAYTVILVQTSDGLTSGTNRSGTNTTS
ncbi:gustatory receptor for sugar taste 64d-like [Dermacentor albipictus]|uniref:gustatory receptor for sugar taste 64d-like n=1 Tax=Dermacentor albipictus TaxID=60249 RepID=UPI0038FC0A91